MSLDKYDLYIFDWDGTLSTSTTLVRLSRIFQSRYNLDEVRKHKDKYVVRDSELRSSKKIGEYEKENAQEAMFFSNFYVIYSFLARPKLRDGALETLRSLKRRRKLLALFSDSRLPRLKSELVHTKVFGYFDVILTGDLIRRYKPYPKGLLMIAKEMKVDVNKCLYIGDMATDIMTAKFAGMPSCAVGGGMDPYALLKDAQPDYLFKDIHEFYKKLQSSL